MQLGLHTITNDTGNALSTHLFIAHHAVGSEALHLDDAVILEEAIVQLADHLQRSVCTVHDSALIRL